MLIQLYYALVYPYLIYCYTTWAVTYFNAIENIVKLQKKIMRIITFSHFNAHTNDLFFKFKILKFQSLDMYLTGCLMYKVKSYIVPSVYRKLFTETSTIHNYNTRQIHTFYVQQYRTNLGKFSILAHGPNIWKTLPYSVLHSTSTHMFKKRLKSYTIHTQYFI